METFGLWRHILSPLHILSPATMYAGTLGIYCRPKAYMKFLPCTYYPR